MTRRLKRAAGLLLALALAGCGGSPPQTFAPLNYSYLPPITLKVAAVNVVNSYATDPAAAPLLAEDPAPPAAVLGTELARRLIASGSPGTATVTIEDASVAQAGGTLSGAMTVRIDVASADGQSSGFTEASVTHSAAAPGSDDDMPAALYDMTKQLMDAMNVQLQYHVQHDLGGWVVGMPNAFGAAPGFAAQGFAAQGFAAPGLAAAPAGGAILAAPLAAPASSGAAAPSPSLGAPQNLSPASSAPPGVGTPAPLPGQTLQLPPSYLAPPQAVMPQTVTPQAVTPQAVTPYVAPPAPPPLAPNPTAPQNLVPY